MEERVQGEVVRRLAVIERAAYQAKRDVMAGNLAHVPKLMEEIKQHIGLVSWDVDFLLVKSRS